jgi:Na+/proline symporter
MKTKLVRACFAGFLGTIIVTCMMTFASPTLIGGPADLAAMLAGLLGGSWLAGMGMHFMVGTLVLPATYVALLDRRLPGGPAVRGMAWGLTLWLVAQTILIPVGGGGFFSAELGGLHIVTDSLVGHLAYGLVLGVLAGEPNERAFSMRQEFVTKTRLRRAG